jgi:ATP-dependent DNA ligase
LPGKTSRNITTILGCGVEKAIQRQANDADKLRLSVFDVIAYHGMHLHSQPITDRIEFLEKIRAMNHPFADVVNYWTTPDSIHDNWLNILSSGGEGVVLTKKDNPYEFGKRTARHTLKLKKELQETIDVFLTGRYKEATKLYTGKEIETWQYWENLITDELQQGELFKFYQEGGNIDPVTKGYFNKWCGSLEIAVLRHRVGSKCKINGVVYEDTEVFPIGWLSGVPDEMKANPKKFAFQPMEVTAMEFDDINYTLRHGKMVGWRKDLTLADCNFEKIQG